MTFEQSAGASGRKFLGLLCLLALLFIPAVSPVRGAETPRRVFLIEGLTATQPAAQRTVEAFTRRLKDQSSEDIEIYSEFLDLGRFRGPQNENRLVQFLGAKFAQAKPDVIVPISRGAVSFMLRHRDEFPRDIPIVYCCTPALMTDTLDIPSNIPGFIEKSGALEIPMDVPGVVEEFDWPRTLALAQRLQPDAHTVVFISGASDLDRRREEEMMRALQPFLRTYNIRHLSGLRYNELLKQVSRLPRNSIVFLPLYVEDGSGRLHGAEVAADVSKASTAPLYSSIPSYLGSGIVGGRMETLTGQGTQVADLVLDILSGADPSSLPHQTRIPLQYRVDARQLERWGIAQAALPPGTLVEFRQPTLWEQYRTTVVLVVLAFVMLVCFIALLLIEIRRRHKAEEIGKTALAEAEFRREEVTFLMRVAAVSELSGGIAHELGQPLTAILANAQAAQRLVAANSPDKKEIVEILGDIVEEDSRAAEVIHGLRRLLKKGERQADLISLNEQVASALRLVHSELVSRKIKVQTDLEPQLPFIFGDRVQLQQVFLNLIMNAMDAMAAMPASERRLRVRTRSMQNANVEVSITDGGPGMSADELKRVFEPFFTTKQHGLGLGLPICSTIVRSHHGQLNVSNSDGGGVHATVSLPAVVLAEAS